MKKIERSISHYDDNTIESLKNYYNVEGHHSSDHLKFIKNMEYIMIQTIDKAVVLAAFEYINDMIGQYRSEYISYY